MDATNTNFQLAADFIRNTNRPVFLTGKAGTGKTTFLKYIRDHSNKQTAVLAPTGVAAINAGGVTIHSFFNLPFGPFLPGTKKGFSGSSDDGVNDKHSLIGRLRYNKDKIHVLQGLELMIIDEVSMVRGDIMDAIDTILKHFRRKYNEPFGGVQVLFIGDMFQLPPVVKEDEWQLLQEYYNSPFFFDSLVLREDQPLHIELEKIYRQSDQYFIDVLNQVRNNRLDEDGMELLHSRYKPDFFPYKEDGYITLTTHNYKADNINGNELEKIPGKSFVCKATITGDFGEKMFPAEESLQLKEGAQVMFIKNDVGNIRKYYNGKIGVLKRYDSEDEKIFVDCEEGEVEVKKETWKNIRYAVNKEKQELEEDEIGSFTQFPLRLAWAVTIHKSQGLTFEKAIIDAGAAFAPGQVYVALSRCTSLEGLVLRSKITPSSVITDDRIIRFAKQKNSAEQLLPHLNEAKFDYQCNLLLELFNVESLVIKATLLEKLMAENNPFFNAESTPYVQQLKQRTDTLQQVAQKFQQQLRYYFQEKIVPEENPVLQQRLKDAVNWFCMQLQEGILQPVKKSPAKTDNKMVAALLFDALHELNKEAMFLHKLMDSCKAGFEADRFLKARSKTNISMVLESAVTDSNSPFSRARKPKSVAPKPDTKLESYKLFTSGKSIPEIAEERKLTTGTIETHLGHYVLTGDLQLEQVLAKEKIDLIVPVVKEIGGNSSAPIKDKIGTAVSYAEVRLVMQWMEKENGR